MTPVRRRAVLALLAPATLLAACAAPTPTPASSYWAGRLSLRLDDPGIQPFSAAFELRGSPQAGELRLGTPVGTTVALLSWGEGRALLRAGSNVQSFASLDALVAHVTGTSLPVAALFDWLQGRDTHVAGWQVDLSGLEGGRLSAQRLAPAPAAQLRLLLER